MVYIGSSLQMHEKRMDLLHYKLLRVAVKDWRRQYPRNMLDTLGRSKPSKFGHLFIWILVSECLQNIDTKLIAHKENNQRIYHQTYNHQKSTLIVKNLNKSGFKKFIQ